jgi:hypothetical protein
MRGGQVRRGRRGPGYAGATLPRLNLNYPHYGRSPQIYGILFSWQRVKVGRRGERGRGKEDSSEKRGNVTAILAPSLNNDRIQLCVPPHAGSNDSSVISVRIAGTLMFDLSKVEVIFRRGSGCSPNSANESLRISIILSSRATRSTAAKFGVDLRSR